jgi:hypothetical protein
MVSSSGAHELGGARGPFAIVMCVVLLFTAYRETYSHQV